MYLSEIIAFFHVPKSIFFRMQAKPSWTVLLQKDMRSCLFLTGSKEQAKIEQENCLHVC